MKIYVKNHVLFSRCPYILRTMMCICNKSPKWEILRSFEVNRGQCGFLLTTMYLCRPSAFIWYTTCLYRIKLEVLPLWRSIEAAGGQLGVFYLIGTTYFIGFYRIGIWPLDTGYRIIQTCGAGYRISGRISGRGRIAG